MRRCPLGNSKGSTLVLNAIIMVVFSMMAVIVYAGAKSMVGEVVYNQRSAQALAIAEAGLEDALHSVYQNSTWTTGFTDKSFAGGKYTVTVTTDVPPSITATGYSAALLLRGAAVRTIVARAEFTTGACPYAVLADKALDVEGRVDAYDLTVSSTPTSFITGANVRSNNGVSVSGVACPPAHIYGDVMSIGASPSASCVTGSVVTTTTVMSIISDSCGSCETVNDDLTGITPSSAYNNGAQSLTVGAGNTVTLSSGTYFFKKITINGILNVNTSSGTAAIYVKNNFTTGSSCQFNNTSKIPARVHFYSTNSGNIVTLNCTTPFHGYLEGSQSKFILAQELYGHFCADSVQISSNSTAGYGRIHYDLGGGVLSHVGWTTGAAGSWAESYKRQ